jgi:tRNA pseudouridine55 synthase
MAKRRKGRAINGVLLLDKPYEMSSNHALQAVKRVYFAQKAGHTGALDPLATGMLPICLGEGTKFSQFLLDTDKTYQVTAKLGIRTTTSDADGEIVSEKEVAVSTEQLNKALDSF